MAKGGEAGRQAGSVAPHHQLGIPISYFEYRGEGRGAELSLTISSFGLSEKFAARRGRSTVESESDEPSSSLAHHAARFTTRSD